MTNIDTSTWRQLTASPYGGYFLVEPGIIATIPKQGVEQTVAAAREQLQRLQAVVVEMGRPLGNIVLVDRVAKQSSDARRIWSQEVDVDTVFACALVCSSTVGCAIGTIFMGIRRPKVETRMFAEFGEALAWMQANNKAWERARGYALAET